MTRTKTIAGAPAIHQGAARRLFMRQAGALSFAAGAGAPLALNLLAAGSAAAQNATDYRAIVCLFMHGGNDSFNTVLATDGHNGAGAAVAGSAWAHYTTTRNQAPASIALLAPGMPGNPAAVAGTPAHLGGVLPINPLNLPGRGLALHPVMASLQTLFNADKRLAIVANVGPLITPTTKQQYGLSSHPKPPILFSHNDQQSVWQTMGREGTTEGWGGRMADLLMSANTQPIFTSISTGSSAAWLSGRQASPYQVSPSGAVRMGTYVNGGDFINAGVAATLRDIARTAGSAHVLEIDHAAVSRRSIEAEELLRTSLKSASDPAFGTAPQVAPYSPAADPKLQYLDPITNRRTFNRLAHQLQKVARLVEAGKRGAIGAKRQVFFVNIGGFDTHSGQNAAQPVLLAQLAHALQYFDGALGAINARHDVTTFTASDFGRTFTSNGDGTDHGWGSHQFVMGGAVKGGNVYGTLPTLGARIAGGSAFASPDQLANGVLLPTTSVDQLGATLGRWFGLSDSQLTTVFPNLANFNVSSHNLGFMA